MKRSLIWDEVCLKSSGHIQADEKSGKDFSTNSTEVFATAKSTSVHVYFDGHNSYFRHMIFTKISKRCCWIMSAMTPTSCQKRTLMNSYINIHTMGSAQTEYIGSTNFGHRVINPFK